MTGWLINKFFPGREQLKSKMAALFESGLMVKLEKVEYQEYKDRKPGRKNFNLEEPSFSLNLEDIQGILGILFTGYLVSCIAFMIEYIFYPQDLPSGVLSGPTQKESNILQFEEIAKPYHVSNGQA